MENQNQPTSTTPNKETLQTLKTWTNFVGIIAIIVGALSCITIVGIIPGVIYIILGMKLQNAKNSIDHYLEGNSREINNIFDHLASFFKLCGILFIVSVALSILTAIIFSLVGFFSFNEFVQMGALHLIN